MSDHKPAGVIKIIELMGVSQSSFSDAARLAVEEASKTIRGISGIEVLNSSAKVDGGKISEYHVTVRIAFPVERSGGDAASAGEESGGATTTTGGAGTF